MRQQPTRSTRTDTFFPYTTLVRCLQRLLGQIVDAAVERADEEVADLEGQEQPEQHQRAALQQRDEAVVALPAQAAGRPPERQCRHAVRSEEHTSELQSLLRISSPAFCLNQKNSITHTYNKCL